MLSKTVSSVVNRLARQNPPRCNSFDNCFTDLVALQPNVPLSNSHPCRNSFSLSRSSSRQIRLNCLRLFAAAQNSHNSETTCLRKGGQSCSTLPVWGTHLLLATRGTRGTVDRKSACESGETDSISQAKATFPTQNRNKTPTRLFIKSGPESSSSLNDRPWSFAVQSKTTRYLFGFCGWNTPWWGRKNWTLLLIDSTLRAWPLHMYPSSISVYCWRNHAHFSIFISIDQDGPTLASNCCCSEHQGATALPLHNGRFWLLLFHKG